MFRVQCLTLITCPDLSGTQNAEQVLTLNAFQFFDILKLNTLKCCETPKGREMHTVRVNDELPFVRRMYAISELIV